MTPTYELVETWVNSISNVYDVDSVIDNGGGKYTLKVCKLLWTYVPGSKKTKIIFNDGNEYSVLSITKTPTLWEIELEGTFIPNLNVDTTLKKLFFLNGTVIATNKALQDITKNNEKYPMAYLYEVLADDFQGIRSPIDRITPIRLFFLNQTDKENFKTKSHYTKVINSMANFAELMIAELNNNVVYVDPDSAKIIPHANFGNFKRDGHWSKIFDDELSGTELGVAFSVYKGVNLCDNCN